MINPAVETDLVGELVRVDQSRWVDHKLSFYTLMIGRVRAVTAQPGGYLLLWVEIVDDEGRRHAELHNDNVAIGDLLLHHIGEGSRIHILRGT